jgi:hypothetical protein
MLLRFEYLSIHFADVLFPVDGRCDLTAQFGNSMATIEVQAMCESSAEEE